LNYRPLQGKSSQESFHFKVFLKRGFRTAYQAAAAEALLDTAATHPAISEPLVTPIFISPTTRLSNHLKRPTEKQDSSKAVIAAFRHGRA
jgi:hypothetical protein